MIDFQEIVCESEICRDVNTLIKKVWCEVVI